VSPVIYVHSDSTHMTLTASAKNIENLQKSSTTPYLKQYAGFQEKRVHGSDPVRKKRRFYDEREWRFVPRGEKWHVTDYASENDLKKEKDKLNRGHLAGMPIKLDEIRYILVGRETEIPEFIKTIRDLSIPSQEQDILITRIITMQQVRWDF
jgi:hypothetical protein